VSDDTVLITRKEYEQLIKRDTWLCALEAAGIDNTEAYGEAFAILEEWNKESFDDEENKS
jgi:hypothetical protein